MALIPIALDMDGLIGTYGASGDHIDATVGGSWVPQYPDIAASATRTVFIGGYPVIAAGDLVEPHTAGIVTHNGTMTSTIQTKVFIQGAGMCVEGDASSCASSHNISGTASSFASSYLFNVWFNDGL